MKIHLVGGFLGSGKTTAIAAACAALTHKGKKIGVVTNDQGAYLVDAEFMSAAGIPSGRVTGGCFCCNYEQLDEQISKLEGSLDPDAIFAESVGSCTDLVATVLKPLLKFRQAEVTFSSFVDARLLLMHLEGTRLPFTTDTIYIWEKQLEEAKVLVVNKVDLLSAPDLLSLQQRAEEKYSDKRLLYQNSLDPDSITRWLRELEQPQELAYFTSLDIDYERYGHGEAELAWLDEVMEISTASSDAVEIAGELIVRLAEVLAEQHLTTGHLKFYLQANGKSAKVSFTALPTAVDVSGQLSVLGPANVIIIMVNARVQTTPPRLRQAVEQVLGGLHQRYEMSVSEDGVSFFQPGFPVPTHREE